MKKGTIITLSGMSGAGKSFHIKKVLEKFNNFEKLKAVTTRKPRKDEQDGIDKYFMTLEEFRQRNDNDELSVVNEIFGNMYAYLKSDIEKLNNGIDLITELYYKDIPEFKKQFPNTVSIYVLPSDVAVAIDKLENRKIKAEEFAERATDIKNELEFLSSNEIDCFDYMLVNNYDSSSVKELENFIVKTINSSVQNIVVSNISCDFKSIVDDYVTNEPKDIVYTSFDGDDMHYLSDICADVVNQGKVPLNPESALGYYVSTVTLGGSKQKVMKDCLTLEMLANELFVYENSDVELSEGIIAEILLWKHMKNSGMNFISDVKDLDNRIVKTLNNNELINWVNNQDHILVYELMRNLLDNYIKNSKEHKTSYVIANMKNYKHIDWARAYCYENNRCPISPQNILPFSLYKNNQRDYLEARLELLKRSSEVTIFVDKFNESEEIISLDEFSKAELYYLQTYCPEKKVTIVGWNEAKVPKYNYDIKWSLTTKEDLVTRQLIKRI